jgi:hypothetical protein
MIKTRVCGACGRHGDLLSLITVLVNRSRFSLPWSLVASTKGSHVRGR